MPVKDSFGRILIVDDEERMARSLSSLLSGLGYQTKFIVQAKEALAELEVGSYDLVLTDIRMPGVDGFKLLESAKRNDKDSVVVFMTGYGSLESAMRAISKGAYDYLLKPLELEELKVTIQRGLEKRKSDQEKTRLLGELKASNQALEKKLKELDALYQASKSISTTIELSELLQTILQLASQVIGAKTGSIMLLDADRKALTIQASIGLERRIVQKTVLPLGDSIAGYVAAKGEPLVIADVESDSRFKRINKAQYETRSLLSAPLKVQNKVIGVINLNNKQDGTGFTQEDLKLLATFASPAAVAIDDAYHYNQVKNRVSQLSVLYELATSLSHLGEFNEIAHLIYAKLKELFPIDYCLWFIWNEGEGVLDLKHREGELGKKFPARLELPFRKGDLFQIEKLKQKLEKTLSQNGSKKPSLGVLTAFPVLADGHLHGVFCVGSSQEESLSQAQREVVSIVASQAAALYERQRGLLNATRLMTMGNLVSEITHDLKRPLTNIKNSLQLLIRKNVNSPQQKELLNSAEQEVLRLTELVKELINFSRPESYHPERKSVTAILDRALALVEPDMSERKIELVKQYPSDLPSILLNEKTILEAFLNIIINALDSMPEGGRLTVSARIEQVPEREGRFLSLHFQDSGCGISKENLPRIMERYFTTKGGGAGLGLAVVDRVVKAHNGLIQVESKNKKGTLFKIFLPQS